MKKSLKLTNISVHYQDTGLTAIDKISFDIPQGQIVALVGPNGSGKSSLLKAILGLVKHSGTVELFGKKRNSRALNTGYVPQGLQIDKTLPITIKEFLQLALITCNHSKQEKNELINESLDKVNMNNMHSRILSSLSGGQLQKILLARAIVHKPKLLILDEPETSIDASGENNFYKLLQNLSKKDKVTVLFSSHELETIKTFVDNIIYLKN